MLNKELILTPPPNNLMGWQITVSLWTAGYLRGIGYAEGSEGACSKLTENTPDIYFLCTELVGGVLDANKIEMNAQDQHGTIRRADNNNEFSINPGSPELTPTEQQLFTYDDVGKTIKIYYEPGLQ